MQVDETKVREAMQKARRSGKVSQWSQGHPDLPRSHLVHSAHLNTSSRVGRLWPFVTLTRYYPSMGFGRLLLSRSTTMGILPAGACDTQHGAGGRGPGPGAGARPVCSRATGEARASGPGASSCLTLVDVSPCEIRVEF